MKLLSIEKVAFSDFVKDPSQYAAKTQAYANLRHEWVSEEMCGRGWSWIVLCGGEVIAGSSNLDDFPNNEQLAELGERHGFIPFGYMVPDDPEEITLQSLKKRDSVDFVGSAPSLEC